MQATLAKKEFDEFFNRANQLSRQKETEKAEHPKLAQLRDITRFGVNLQFVEPETILSDGDEVVLIPPVSGG